ncbi:hypothetical protein T265_01744 [Opisthorchis viverrini]|uniref:Uncharacterized protein n=1 Tax=Opisthorchis viverrini TaxID=6198 RepID=A0A075A1K4_OPIVI|nr:hypothetical protein T265_01744 [Opisthorchis viverrini]KER32122.1 hypothetical protein T265_01744 [Opisthorchis viverrini]
MKENKTMLASKTQKDYSTIKYSSEDCSLPAQTRDHSRQREARNRLLLGFNSPDLKLGSNPVKFTSLRALESTAGRPNATFDCSLQSTIAEPLNENAAAPGNGPD